MGGKAFSHGPNPLSTPRIPPALHATLRQKYITLLSTFYTAVASPLDAPEKPSHGDIDLLVSSPIHPFPPSTLSHALHAHATLPAHPTTSFAVPHPDIPATYIQLDLHLCPPATFRWELCTHAHGDLWNILRTSLRAVGLTANATGLHLRVAAVEPLDRKRSLLFLSADPDDVLAFLGLDAERYGRVFEREEELFAYAAGMRFFRREAYARDGLGAGDRKKVGLRPVFRRFVEEWLPSWEGGGDGDGGVTRERVLEEALERYGRRETYGEMVRTWEEERAELGRRVAGREARREGVKAEMAYADAWIEAERAGLRERGRSTGGMEMGPSRER